MDTKNTLFGVDMDFLEQKRQDYVKEISITNFSKYHYLSLRSMERYYNMKMHCFIF
jgi:hypothetical protein